jgi:hypothetical protein
VITSKGDGTTDSFKIYMDAGTPASGAGKAISTPAFADATNEITIGKGATTTGSRGMNVDEVAIWFDYVLTSDEVGLIYSGGLPGDVENTTGLTVPNRYWRMGDLTDTDGASGVVYDRIGSYNLTADDGDGGGDPLKSTDVPS